MSWPLWEDQRDLQNEQRVADKLARQFHCSFFKLPVAYYVDFAFIRDDNICGLVEVRCRNNSFDQYPTIIVSTQKRMHCLELADHLDVKCIFAIQYLDQLCWIDLAEKPDYVRVGGRNDVRDARDIELLSHYKTERLKHETQ